MQSSLQTLGANEPMYVVITSAYMCKVLNSVLGVNSYAKRIFSGCFAVFEILILTLLQNELTVQKLIKCKTI